jgi:hypothetical protein
MPGRYPRFLLLLDVVRGVLRVHGFEPAVAPAGNGAVRSGVVNHVPAGLAEFLHPLPIIVGDVPSDPSVQEHLVIGGEEQRHVLHLKLDGAAVLLGLEQLVRLDWFALRKQTEGGQQQQPRQFGFHGSSFDCSWLRFCRSGCIFCSTAAF